MAKKTELKAVEPIKETVDNSAELLARRAEKDKETEQTEAELKLAQEQFKREAAGQQAAVAEPLLRWFQSEGLQEPIASVVSAYGNLAMAISKFMKPSSERTVALRKLLESKDAAIRAMFTAAE